jgi:hypothetical protein
MSSQTNQNTGVASEYSQSSQSHTDGIFFKGFPLKWNEPKSSIPRCIFKICCLIFTWHGDLHWLYKILKEGNNWEELHRQYLTQLNQVSTAVSRWLDHSFKLIALTYSCAARTRACYRGSFYLLKSTTCERCRLHIWCILCLFGGIACLFVVWAIAPAKGICLWNAFSKTSYCRCMHCPLSGWQIRVNLTAGHNWEALENILAPIWFGSADHYLYHVSGAFAHG